MCSLVTGVQTCALPILFHALILAAQAFLVLDRPKDARAEQAVTFGLERAVVDGFGLLDLAERPRANTLRARDADLDHVEGFGLRDRVHEVGKLVHILAPSSPLASGERGEEKKIGRAHV